MLLAYSCDYRRPGMHEVGYLLYVARLLCSHLDDEHLIVRFEMLADCSYHTEGRVEAPRGHCG